MDLTALIRHPENMDQTTLAELRALVEQFPCMQAARLLLVENAFRLDDENYRAEAEKAAVLVPNRKVLFDLTQGTHCAKWTRRKRASMTKKRTHRRERISPRR